MAPGRVTVRIHGPTTRPHEPVQGPDALLQLGALHSTRQFDDLYSGVISVRPASRGINGNQIFLPCDWWQPYPQRSVTPAFHGLMYGGQW